ncbi:MAG: L-threonylcarbamoyladenylate synthase [Burkholderiaceae bacterium]
MIVAGSAPESIALAARALRSGDLVGLPTETVYGLAADAASDAAVAKVFAAKGRPSDHPLIVHVADATGVDYFARDVPDFARKLIQTFWPGPLTLILKRKPEVGAAAAGGQDSIGLRCPAHAVAHEVLLACRALGVQGVAAPSANQFGRVSPTTAEHVHEEFGDSLLILDGGACQVGIESTIIDCSRGVPVLLRPGAITREQVQLACGLKLLSPDELKEQAPRASGTLESHYAPLATVRLMDASALRTAHQLLMQSESGSVPLSSTIAIYSRVNWPILSPQFLYRAMPVSAVVAAHELFAVLREFDAQGVKLIWIETPPDFPEWEGVRDRLQRAAA